MVFQIVPFTGLEPAVGGPGHHRVGHQQRGRHGDRHVKCDRVEILPRHAADHQQRAEHQHDRQRRQVGGVADFVGGLHRDQAFVLFAKTAVVAVDVFDHDNRAIDQQAQRQDECEQRNAVDGQAKEIGSAQGQGQDQRHGHAHDQCFLQSQKRGSHQEHGQHRDTQVLNQPADGGVRLLAVVTGDDQFDPCRYELRLHALDALQHIVGNKDGVAAGFLGHGQRDGRHLRLLRLAKTPVRRAKCETAQVRALLRRTVDDLCHIAQIDGAPGMAAHDHALEVLRRAQKAVQEHLAVLALLHHRAQRRGDIACAQGGMHLVQRDAEGLQALRVQLDAQFPVAPALDGNGRDLVQAA